MVPNLDPLHGLGILLALAGIAYLALAVIAVARFRERPSRGASSFRPPITLMVPAYGLQPGLYDCLHSLCLQDYPRLQMIFGLHDTDDPARPVIERVMREFPELDTRLVIDPRMIGANPKNCNLANMYPAAKHDIIVMVDSDVRVDRDFLATITAPLEDPAVGGVTCVYKAVPAGNLASALGALAINDWFVPSAFVNVAIRELEVCYGAAIAVTRAALEGIGGFAAMASAAAQDFVFGQELTRHGYKIRLAPAVVETIVAEPDLKSLFHHYLRWNRATRACRPLDHALSVVTHPLPLAAALLLLPEPSTLAIDLLIVLVATRLLLHILVRRRIAIAGPATPWLVPVEECLACAVWLMSFVVRNVRWGRRQLRVIGDARMVAAEEDRA